MAQILLEAAEALQQQPESEYECDVQAYLSSLGGVQQVQALAQAQAQAQAQEQAQAQARGVSDSLFQWPPMEEAGGFLQGPNDNLGMGFGFPPYYSTQFDLDPKYCAYNNMQQQLADGYMYNNNVCHRHPVYM